jgi:FkbM family methyltransferase
MRVPGLSRLRAASVVHIARNRRSPTIRSIHRLARQFEDAYDNVDLDMSTNGEAEVLRRLASAGFAVAFDVGAHTGSWTLAALREWPIAFIHAFEVAHRTFQDLTANVGQAGVETRVALNAFGLGDARELATMYYFPGHPDLTCDRPRHTGRDYTTFQAEVGTGDDYVVARRISRIDFMKIDVEGAEYKVLRGLSETIANGAIQCIQFEYGAFSTQTRVLLGDYYTMLAPYYWIGKIYPSYVEFTDYTWTMEDFRFANFLAVSRGRPDLKDELSH